MPPVLLLRYLQAMFQNIQSAQYCVSAEKKLEDTLAIETISDMVKLKAAEPSVVR